MAQLKLSVMIAGTLLLTACTTQKALKETKRQYDNGEYGWALYTATMGVTMAALVDVFTLGGTSDVETGYNTISSVANKGGNQTATATASGSAPSASTLELAANHPGRTSSTSPVIQTAQATSGNSGSQLTAISSAPTAAVKSGKSYPDASHCLTRDATSNSLCDFWVNKCSFPVTVMWFDGKYCDTGCMTGVKANGRESITKGVPGSQYTYAACPKPSDPRGPDKVRQWKNEGVHNCVF